MSKSIYELIKDIQDYFKYRKPLHLSFGRKIVPTYIVNPVPTIQSPAVVDEALTQNTWYTVLDTSLNVRVYNIRVVQTVANEDIEVRITDDVGVATVIAWTAVAGTAYNIVKYCNDGTAASRYTNSATGEDAYSAFVFESRSLKVEVRKTTAAGANNTMCRVNWGQW